MPKLLMSKPLNVALGAGAAIAFPVSAELQKIIEYWPNRALDL
jgi:hypothetical protein